MSNCHLLIHQRRYTKRLISDVGGGAEWSNPGPNRNPCDLLDNTGIDHLIHEVWILMLPGTALFNLGTFIVRSWM